MKENFHRVYEDVAWFIEKYDYTALPMISSPAEQLTITSAHGEFIRRRGSNPKILADSDAETEVG